MTRWSWDYALIKFFTKRALWLYFGKNEAYGVHHVPTDKPVMFAANHQGTFMDGVLMVWKTPLQISVLARADIFKTKMARRLLKVVKIVPIYRKRDKVDVVSKNEDVFRDCYTHFNENRGSIMIYPEGNQSLIRHLRPFKKGVARIAFGAEELTDFNSDLVIIPTGIHYREHRAFQTDIMIQFSPPVSVKDYKDLYEKDKEQAITTLTADVRKRVKPLMFNVEDVDRYEEHYVLFDILRHEFEPSKFDTLKEEVDLEQEREKRFRLLKEEDSDGYNNLMDKAAELKERYKTLDVRDWQFAEGRKYDKLKADRFFLFGLPAFAVCFLNVFPCYCFIKFLLKRFNVGDNFMGSMKFGLGLFLGGLFFIFQAILMGSLYFGFWAGLVYLIMLPLMGVFWYDWNRNHTKRKHWMRFEGLEKDGRTDEVAALRNEIKENLQKLF